MSNVEMQKMRYHGTFQFDGNDLSGVIIYNRERGVISLILTKIIPDKDALIPIAEQNYGRFPYISGILNNGTPVTLYNCRCVKNFSNLDIMSQELRFHADYIIWNNTAGEDRKYHRCICVIENGLLWSGLSQIEFTGCVKSLTFNSLSSQPHYKWFGADISFSTSLDHNWSVPQREVTTITERLQITIKTDKEESVDFFIQIRNHLLAMISFAIKDNTNICYQYLTHNDDRIGEKRKGVMQYSLTTNEPYHHLRTQTPDSYNFMLEHLSKKQKLAKSLQTLTPVFNLYLSLFKYSDMPKEMVFLNMIQAVETFHARFFRPKKYLKERIVELIADNNSGKFASYLQNNYPQQLVDTRNYYTHYDRKHESLYLRDNALVDATKFLASLLEHHILKILEINTTHKIDLDSYSFHQIFSDEAEEKK